MFYRAGIGVGIPVYELVGLFRSVITDDADMLIDC